MRALSDADRAIGRLAGEGGRLRQPAPADPTFVRREAVLSSRIEGTQATLGELLAAEAGVAVNRSPEDLREVANYVTALEYGVARLKKLPLSLRLVRELHERLMRGVRGDMAYPGEFRRTQNWIGAPGSTLANAIYVPPPVDEMKAALGAWETFLHDRSLPPLVQVALIHSQFEAIHPFVDGNGRVGRLMITLFLVEREILPTPLLYLSAFFEASRRDYYDGLLGVTQRGDWPRWIEYFLQRRRPAGRGCPLASGEDQPDSRPLAREGGWALGDRAALRGPPGREPVLDREGRCRAPRVAFTTAQRAVDGAWSEPVSSNQPPPPGGTAFTAPGPSSTFSKSLLDLVPR